jgi:hypothetical protein
MQAVRSLTRGTGKKSSGGKNKEGKPEKPKRSATSGPSDSTDSTPNNLSKSSVLSKDSKPPLSRSSTSKTSSASSSNLAETEILTNDQLKKIHREKVAALKTEYGNAYYKPKLEELVKEHNRAIARAQNARAEKMKWPAVVQ